MNNFHVQDLFEAVGHRLFTFLGGPKGAREVVLRSRFARCPRLRPDLRRELGCAEPLPERGRERTGGHERRQHALERPESLPAYHGCAEPPFLEERVERRRAFHTTAWWA